MGTVVKMATRGCRPRSAATTARCSLSAAMASSSATGVGEGNTDRTAAASAAALSSVCAPSSTT